MKKYDPLVTPDATAWLQMDEQERLALVRAYHSRERIRVPNSRAHAVAHAVIENQLAEGLVPTLKALERLLGEGLDRHEAVHALSTVLMEHISNLMKEPRGDGDPSARYFDALDKLTAASWRSLA